MKKFSVLISLMLLLAGCGASESADGNRSAGDCTALGEVIENNGETAICIKLDTSSKYVIEGPAIEDIKLLAGIKSNDFYLSEVGQTLAKELNWDYQDFSNVEVDSLNLKRYIADKPEWKEIAALILAEEKAKTDLDYVEKNYCPADPEAYCAPKTMSAEGAAEWDRTSAIWDAAVTALNDKLELIGVAIEGQYQISGLKAAEFVIKSAKTQ